MTRTKFDSGRRDFLTRAGLAAAAEFLPRHLQALASPASQNEKLIGIQISAISFTDEGIDRVLDILQEKASVNTLFLSAFTYDLGTGGRQVPGRPLPDHGKQEYDNFHGGDFALRNRLRRFDLLQFFHRQVQFLELFPLTFARRRELIVGAHRIVSTRDQRFDCDHAQEAHTGDSRGYFGG